MKILQNGKPVEAMKVIKDLQLVCKRQRQELIDLKKQMKILRQENLKTMFPW